MRLWSVHPKYLDRQGLVAVWREALLARAVLRGRTRGYRHHPQLQRFLAHRSPRMAINCYLQAVYAESLARGYTFDRSRFGPVRKVSSIRVPQGQMRYEARHLRRKLSVRSPAWLKQSPLATLPEPHPLFRLMPGPVAEWERR
jgi:hypothetical protein